MITALTDLYATISTELPGVSTEVLATEFKKAERKACLDAGIWDRDTRFLIEEDTYKYTLAIPEDAELVASLSVADDNDKVRNVSEYTVGRNHDLSRIGYSITPASTEPLPEGLGTLFVNSGVDHAIANVYKTESDEYYLWKKTGVSEWYIGTKATFTTIPDAPVDYLKNTVAFDGTFIPGGAWVALYGQATSVENTGMLAVDYDFEETTIDGLSEYDVVWTAVHTLAPIPGTSAAPSQVLTQYADLICNLALLNLLRYPRNFPWSDPVKAREVDPMVRRMLSKAKLQRYTPNKRMTIKMTSPSFI